MPPATTAGVGPGRMEFWGGVARSLARAVPLPERRTDAPLDEWLRLVRSGYRRSEVPAEPLVAHGLALADMVSFDRVDREAARDTYLSLSDVRLMTALQGLADRGPVRLGVRDAVGWVLVFEGVVGREMGPRVPDSAVGLVSHWDVVRLGHDGWV